MISISDRENWMWEVVTRPEPCWLCREKEHTLLNWFWELFLCPSCEMRLYWSYKVDTYKWRRFLSLSYWKERLFYNRPWLPLFLVQIYYKIKRGIKWLVWR